MQGHSLKGCCKPNYVAVTTDGAVAMVEGKKD